MGTLSSAYEYEPHCDLRTSITNSTNLFDDYAGQTIKVVDALY